MNLPTDPTAIIGGPELASRFMPLITGGWKSFSAHGVICRVMSDFTIKVKAGSRLCLMGPNACGKSTLINILLGLECLDSGQLHFVANADDWAGAVLQDYRRQLLPWASVKTNLLLPLSRSHRFDITDDQLLAKSTDFLKCLGHSISLHQKVGTLSGGQQQALVLARSTAFSPRLWILDEGMSAIDLGRRSSASELLVSQCAGRTAIFISHDLDDSLRLGTHLVVLDGQMNIATELPIERDPHCDIATFLKSKEASDIRSRVLDALGRPSKNGPSVVK